MSSPVWIVAEREIRERLRDRGFLIFTLVLVLSVLAVPAYQYISGGDEEAPAASRFSMALYGSESEAIGEAVRERGEASGLSVSLEKVDSAAAAKNLIRDAEVDSAVVDGQRFLVGESADPVRQALVQSVATGLSNYLKRDRRC